MEIDELIEAYLASHQKQFVRLSKNGVARIAYLAGYLAAQQSVQPTVLCTCETIDTQVTKLLDSACPVHGSHSG